ncbi:hypothetical protein [Oceaniovalibus sp. ACAM 378]|jgi:Flp pilus assembly protein CpaB|nr:hypothetical protein [Oceaniovalibus sp. ACAM 378]
MSSKTIIYIVVAILVIGVVWYVSMGTPAVEPAVVEPAATETPAAPSN